MSCRCARQCVRPQSRHLPLAGSVELQTLATLTFTMSSLTFAAWGSQNMQSMASSPYTTCCFPMQSHLSGVVAACRFLAVRAVRSSGEFLRTLTRSIAYNPFTTNHTRTLQFPAVPCPCVFCSLRFPAIGPCTMLPLHVESKAWRGRCCQVLLFLSNRHQKQHTQILPTHEFSL